jgi:hypothetical protein
LLEEKYKSDSNDGIFAFLRACSGFSAVGKNRLIFCQFLRF